MSHPAPQGDGRISRVHNMALCAEIGDRLGASLDHVVAEVPEHLQLLLARFRDETAAVQPDAGP